MMLNVGADQSRESSNGNPRRCVSVDEDIDAGLDRDNGGKHQPAVNEQKMDGRKMEVLGPKRKSLEESTRDLVSGISNKKTKKLPIIKLDGDDDEEEEEATDATIKAPKGKAARPPKPPGLTYKVCDEATRHCTRIRCSDGTSFSFLYAKYGGRAKTLKMAQEWVSRENNKAKAPAKAKAK